MRPVVRITISQVSPGVYKWEAFDALGVLVEASADQPKARRTFASRQAAAENHRLKHSIENVETFIPDEV